MAILSWALYDFANTIFSGIVLTLYFPLYLTRLAGANWYLGAATTASMILAGLAVPLLGAVSDETGRSKRYLIYTTLLCILLLCLLSASQNPVSLIVIFVGACFFYHASLVFYNSLLPVAAPPEKQGWASGLGTGLGYLGLVAALPIAYQVDKLFGTRAVFPMAGILFFVFSLPLFFFVPERKITSPIGVPGRQFGQLWRQEWAKLFGTIRGLGSNPRLAFFLLGNFFVVDALNSTIFWFAIYADKVFSPPKQALTVLVVTVNAAAFIFGIVCGFLTDRFGAMRTLILAAAILTVTLALLAWTDSYTGFLWMTATGGAFAIAGIWTAGRKVLLELVPAERVGEFFGLYGLTTKVSVIGSLAFSIVADLAGFRPALLLLVFPAAAGLFFLIFSVNSASRSTTV